MNMKRKICGIFIAAAGIALLSACGNGSSSDSHVIPHAGGSRTESSEATPQSDSLRAANDLYNAAGFAVIDMSAAKMDLTKLNGDYTFRGSDCADKKMLSKAENEMDLLTCVQGDMQNYFEGITELGEIALHFENGRCTATAVGGDGVYAGYPRAEDDSTTYGTLDEALKAALANVK